MTKNIIRNPLDEDTCDYCKAKEGTEVVLLSEANEIPYHEDCENMDNEIKCRCYVALEVQNE